VFFWWGKKKTTSGGLALRRDGRRENGGTEVPLRRPGGNASERGDILAGSGVLKGVFMEYAGATTGGTKEEGGITAGESFTDTRLQGTLKKGRQPC